MLKSLRVYSLNQVFVRAFYARGEAMTPVKVALGMAGLNLVLNLLLIWTPLQVAGLAWSTAICAVLQSIVLYRLLERRLPGIMNRTVLFALARILVLSVMTAVAAIIAYSIMEPGTRTDHWFYQLASLLVIVCSGAGAALVSAWLSGMPELAWFLGRETERSQD